MFDNIWNMDRGNIIEAKLRRIFKGARYIRFRETVSGFNII
jgi:hypothetical protein